MTEQQFVGNILAKERSRYGLTDAEIAALQAYTLALFLSAKKPEPMTADAELAEAERL